jgi:hypothetical protein
MRLPETNTSNVRRFTDPTMRASGARAVSDIYMIWRFRGPPLCLLKLEGSADVAQP